MAIDFITDGCCTGCGACRNICPANAVSMQLDRDGFYKPQVIPDRCIECEMCRKKCPVNYPAYHNDREPAAYAFMAEDSIRMRSSSGGAFEVLACAVLNQMGFVCGVAYKEDYTTEHMMIHDKADLGKLQGSKYVMSDVRTVYREIGERLDEGKKVLFSGCPCQVAGLNAYLGDRSQSANLISVDLICHGIPSVKAFQKYLRDVHGNRPVSYVGFKDKEYGWHASMTIKFKDGEVFNEPCEKDVYFWSYLSGVNKNAACGDCPFARLPRQGDITIGDFWGISDYKKELNDGKGTSVVLINNKKGERFFAEAVPHASKVEAAPLEAAVKRNTNILRSPRNHISRNQFFRQLDSKRFGVAAPWSYQAERYDIGLVGIPTFPNFGGALTYYALYSVLSDMGYSTTLISRPRSSGRPPIMPEKVYEVNPYPGNALKLEFKDKDAMFAMNENCETFVVGSDQLFNADLYYRFGEIVTLDWVTDRHRKIAYAASFGHNVFWGSENQRGKMAHFMQKFDAFSVREEEGVKLAKETFGVDAVWALDPVFLCEKKHYEKVSENTKRKNNKPHIFAYILDPDDRKNDILDYCRRKTGLDVDLYSEMLYEPTPEKLQAEESRFRLPLRQAKIDERLYSLIHSDFIVTDSFHGVCFAVIFEIPFVAILNENRGASRFHTILNKLRLSERLVADMEQLKRKEKLLYGRMDFSKSKEILEGERRRCLAWLRNAIRPENEEKKPFSSVDIIDEKIRSLKKQNQYTDIKMNALLNGRLFMTVSNIISYLDMLSLYRQELIIAVAVKDTPGFAFTEEMAEKMRAFGCRISLVDKHWKGYVALIDGGKIIAENISRKEERVAYVGNLGGKNYKVVSRPYRQGNISAIIIDGVEYSENRRGVNIVVLDKSLNAVIDTVSFDTHMKHTPCYRFGELCKTSLPTKKGKPAPAPTQTGAASEADRKQKEATANPPGIDKPNETLLHNAMAIAAAGGCSLDYYVDKEIQKIAIYGTDLLAGFLWEQAYYKGIEVACLVSDRNREIEVRFPRPGKIELLDIHTLDLREIETPIVVAGLEFPTLLYQRRREGASVEKLGDLNYYSHCKRFLFDRLRTFKEQNPGVNIAVLNMRHAYELENRSEQENQLAAGEGQRNRKQIFESVYGVHGYTEEYVQEVTSSIKVTTHKGINFVADKSGRYVNAMNGYRLTTDTGFQFSHTVYLFGNSVCYGVGAHDEYTIGSVLQRELNTYYGGQAPYGVLNCGNGGGMNFMEQWKSFSFHAPQEGDMAIFVVRCGRLAQEMYQDTFLWCDARQALERPHELGEIYWDLDHLNPVGYEACGKLLARTLARNHALPGREALAGFKPKTAERDGKDVELNLDEAQLSQLKDYIEKLKERKVAVSGRAGAIVMNCNPFTLGHRYLIEESSKKCEALYIFVVEEDRSVFPFADRLKLVEQGTGDLKNVVVIPSGKFIISQTTFQAYFQKEENQEVQIDASKDINIFAAKIAPALNISVRFAGEEPLDKITNQYNATMKRILPQFGIGFEVIPRKESSGEPISASRVRALLAEKDFEGIRKIVPETTYRYLTERFQSSRKILVLGGTRFMGIRLVQKLIERNHFVTIATRGRRKDPFGSRVKRIVYDRLNLTNVQKALGGRHYDVIIDTSAYSSNAVTNVLSNVSCEKYIQVSSVAAYPKHRIGLKEEMLDSKNASFVLSDKEDNYGIGKRYAECAALQLYPAYAPAIVRVPFVVEPDNLDNKELNMRLYFYAEHIVKQIPMQVDNPAYCCSFIRTYEEADFLIYLAENDFEGIYHISSEGYVTVGDIIGYIEQRSGKRAVYSEDGDEHPFRASHFGYTGYSFDLSRAKSTGYTAPKLESWLWELLDHYIDLLNARQDLK